MERKLCQCGCGKPAPIYMRTDRRFGQVKGQPAKFIQGHQHRVYRPDTWNAHEPQWYRDRERRRA